MTDLIGYLARPQATSAEDRARLAALWSARPARGTVLLATCHRVELFGTSETLGHNGAPADREVVVVRDRDVVRHLVTLAVGLDSTVLGEDQVLHQLRVAVQTARGHGGLPTELDRALDLALQAGRRARTWLPPNRPSLVDVALDRMVGEAALSASPVHVVGAGVMGRTAATALIRRGAMVTVGSRTRDTAEAVAARHGVRVMDFDPGPAFLTSVEGVVVALAGEWVLSDESRRALAQSGAWMIDLSSPLAADAELLAAMKGRVLTIDDLSGSIAPPGSPRTRARLQTLARETVNRYETWAAERTQRTIADALVHRARAVQATELDRLRLMAPGLDDQERTEIERALSAVANTLLRDPLEQLGHDRDGHRAQAARELFRL